MLNYAQEMGDLQLTHDGVGFTRFRLPPKNQERVWNYLANWTILLRRVDFEMRSRDGWSLADWWILLRWMDLELCIREVWLVADP